ncbi:MAG: radical SAM protein [Alphaproteobacteria bacterium]|nr:radical SAM protein [Alphaproteobacteria bacterium]
MNQNVPVPKAFKPLVPGKFRDPDTTAKGERRASVALKRLETLWFNTGTLCNIECKNCYIESSPTNDRLVYLTATEVAAYLDEAERLNQRPKTVGFTGGEPFMNPDIAAILQITLSRGYEALVLTNAMKPMMRPRVQAALVDLNHRYHTKLVLRVSLDHWRKELHDEERGPGTFEETLSGLRWLRDQSVQTAIAGRLRWGDKDEDMRAGYTALFAGENLAIDASDPAALVIFPEMDARVDVPEITVDCWRILSKSPDNMMCAASRMIVKRRGAASPAVLACTLLPYDKQFELGPRLADALAPVKLNHPHCAKFCVLGGGSCKA